MVESTDDSAQRGAIIPRDSAGLPSSHLSHFRTTANRIGIMKADTENALETLLIEIEGQQAAFDKTADELASDHQHLLDKINSEYREQEAKLTGAHEAAKAKLLLQREDLLKCKDTLQAALDKAEEIEPTTTSETTSETTNKENE